jgi:phage baseplate assembly protein W
MLPEFAQQMHNLLFEPMDRQTAGTIGQLMLEGIRTWEDRVEVLAINVSPMYDNNEYRVLMDFKIKPLEEEQSVKFVLYAQ